MTEKIVKNCQKHGQLILSQVHVYKYKGRTLRQCLLCKRDRSRKHYADPFNREKKNTKDRQHWAENKETITKRRQDGNYNDNRRKAYHKNPERYREASNVKQQVYRDNLHDTYIKRIIQNGDKNIPLDSIPDGMVKLKRAIMMLKKGIRNKQTSNLKRKLHGNKKHRTTTRVHS